MSTSETATTASRPHWRQPIDVFFDRLDSQGIASFFDVLSELRQLDVEQLARARMSEFAGDYLRATREERHALDRTLPHFGHLVIAQDSNAALSVSIRSRSMSPHTVLATASGHEYHRIVRGQLDVTESTLSVDPAGVPRFSPAATRRLQTGDEILSHAGQRAFALSPASPCMIFSVIGRGQLEFITNVNAISGAVVGQSYALSSDSILANILEICAQLPDPTLNDGLPKYLNHQNYRVRLAALKACHTNQAIEPARLAALAQADPHPTLAALGNKLMELAA